MNVSILLALLGLATRLVSVESFMVPAQTASPSKSCLAAKKKASKDSSSDDLNKVDPAKKAALDGVLQQIERNYGRGSIVKLRDAESMVVESIGSGALTLDTALGGGYPKGRVVEIYGALYCCKGLIWHCDFVKHKIHRHYDFLYDKHVC